MARPRKIPLPTGKAAVTVAISTAGKALATMIETMAVNGAAISQEEFEKAFAFVHRTITALETQARRDRLSISASQFSFDDPLVYATGGVVSGKPYYPSNTRGTANIAVEEVAAQPIILLDPPQPMPTPATRSGMVRPAPRVVAPKPEAKPQPATAAGTPIRHFTGRVSKHSSDLNAGMPVVTALESAPLMGTVVDATDDITFLSE